MVEIKEKRRITMAYTCSVDPTVRVKDTVAGKGKAYYLEYLSKRIMSRM